MITTAQAAEYLDSALGITLPDLFVTAAIERVETVEADMLAAGYSDAQQVLVQCMAVAIIAAAGSPRRITAQGAPSGASRSFKNNDAALSALRRSLRFTDSAGTTAKLIGPDPEIGTLFIVA